MDKSKPMYRSSVILRDGVKDGVKDVIVVVLVSEKR